jgi:hypothetical protein
MVRSLFDHLSDGVAESSADLEKRQHFVAEERLRGQKKE